MASAVYFHQVSEPDSSIQDNSALVLLAEEGFSVGAYTLTLALRYFSRY